MVRAGANLHTSNQHLNPHVLYSRLAVVFYIIKMDYKNCPFCGEKPYKGATGDGRHTLKCYNCGIVMIQDRIDKLKGIWNNRIN